MRFFFLVLTSLREAIDDYFSEYITTGMFKPKGGQGVEGLYSGLLV